MTDLEQKKLEAEIASLKAQAAKALADAAKADIDRANLQKTWREWSLEAIKVVAAIALGVGGLTAAITGYQISEVKKERMDWELTKANEELNELNTKKALTDSAVKQAEQQLAAIKIQVQNLQTNLEAKRGKSVSPGTLDDAIAQAANIGKAVSTTSARLQASKQAYLIGLHTVGVADTSKEQLIAALSKAGYGFTKRSSSHRLDERPTWIAKRSTVFYYANSSLNAARELANLLKQLTGEAFIFQSGYGQGVDPGQESITLVVHYIKG